MPIGSRDGGRCSPSEIVLLLALQGRSVMTSTVDAHLQLVGVQGGLTMAYDFGLWSTTTCGAIVTSDHAFAVERTPSSEFLRAGGS